MRVNYVSGLHGPAQVARVLSGLEAENFDDFIIEENKLSLLFYFIFSSSFFFVLCDFSLIPIKNFLILFLYLV